MCILKMEDKRENNMINRESRTRKRQHIPGLPLDMEYFRCVNSRTRPRSASPTKREQIELATESKLDMNYVRRVNSRRRPRTASPTKREQIELATDSKIDNNVRTLHDAENDDLSEKIRRYLKKLEDENQPLCSEFEGIDKENKTKEHGSQREYARLAANFKTNKSNMNDKDSHTEDQCRNLDAEARFYKNDKKCISNEYQITTRIQSGRITKKNVVKKRKKESNTLNSLTNQLDLWRHRINAWLDDPSKETKKDQITSLAIKILRYLYQRKHITKEDLQKVSSDEPFRSLSRAYTHIHELPSISVQNDPAKQRLNFGNAEDENLNENYASLEDETGRYEEELLAFRVENNKLNEQIQWLRQRKENVNDPKMENTPLTAELCGDDYKIRAKRYRAERDESRLEVTRLNAKLKIICQKGEHLNQLVVLQYKNGKLAEQVKNLTEGVECLKKRQVDYYNTSSLTQFTNVYTDNEQIFELYM